MLWWLSLGCTFLRVSSCNVWMSFIDNCYVLGCLFCFFFKQKTAYEMRISDWSSDVCSSDLIEIGAKRMLFGGRRKTKVYRSIFFEMSGIGSVVSGPWLRLFSAAMASSLLA